jgi:uncharacterized membrane protein YdfJ with MMPL/SSD domain
MGLARRYVSLLEARPWTKFVVALFWLVLVVSGALLVGPFLTHTTNDISVPASAPSAKARQMAIKAGFDFTAGLGKLFLFLENTTSGKPLSEERADSAMQMMRKIVGHSYDLFWDGSLFARERGEVLTSRGFISRNNHSQLASLLAEGDPGAAFMDELAEFVTGTANVVSRETGVKISVLGDARNKKIIISSVTRDLSVGDGICLPFAFLILACALRSARLLTLPLVMLCISCLSTYGAMYVVAITIPIISATMSLVTSILIAFCFDFQLFLLSRYREAIRRADSDSCFEAVVEMLETAGHNCLVSGFTLFFAFSGLALVPQSTLKGLGVGSAVALLFVLLVNLSMTPVLLLWFRGFFFDNFRGPETCWRFVPERVARWWIGEDDSDVSKSWFYRVGKRLTSSTLVACLVIFAVSLFCLAFIYPAVSFPEHISDSFQLALPRDDPFTDAILSMQKVLVSFFSCESHYLVCLQDFGDGFLNTFRILVVPPAGTSLLSDDSFFKAMDDVRLKISTMPNVTCANLMSPFFSFCDSINPLLYSACSIAPTLPNCPDLLRLKKTTMSTGGAIIVISQLSFDPESVFGLSW